MSAKDDPQKAAAKLDVRFTNGNYGAARYGPKGVYHLPEDRTVTGNAQQNATFTFILTFILALWVLTEFIAIRLRFDRSLGHPLLLHIYAPWASLGWMWTLATSHFRSAAFAQSMSITLMLSVALLLAGITISVLYSLRSYRRALLNSRRPPDLRGSAHWASPADLERMGLIPKRR